MWQCEHGLLPHYYVLKFQQMLTMEGKFNQLRCCRIPWASWHLRKNCTINGIVQSLEPSLCKQFNGKGCFAKFMVCQRSQLCIKSTLTLMLCLCRTNSTRITQHLCGCSVTALIVKPYAMCVADMSFTSKSWSQTQVFQCHLDFSFSDLFAIFQLCSKGLQMQYLGEL